MGSTAFPASSVGSAGPSLFSVCLGSCLWAGGVEVHGATHGGPCALGNEALTLRQQVTGWLAGFVLHPPPRWPRIPAQSSQTPPQRPCCLSVCTAGPPTPGPSCASGTFGVLSQPGSMLASHCARGGGAKGAPGSEHHLGEWPCSGVFWDGSWRGTASTLLWCQAHSGHVESRAQAWEWPSNRARGWKGWHVGAHPWSEACLCGLTLQG